jgi:hypothetical protein
VTTQTSIWPPAPREADGSLILGPVPKRFGVADAVKRYKTLLQGSASIEHFPTIRFANKARFRGNVVAVAVCCWTVDTNSKVDRCHSLPVTLAEAVQWARGHECTPFPTARDAVEAAKILETYGFGYEAWLELAA